jgi:hypothetical protein
MINSVNEPEEILHDPEYRHHGWYLDSGGVLSGNGVHVQDPLQGFWVSAIQGKLKLPARYMAQYSFRYAAV